jgi:hypothetical protein
MKAALLMAILLGFGLMVLFYRRRLKLAIMVCGGLYLALIVWRFVLYRDEANRFDDLIIGLGVMAAIWLITNLVTRLLERRRRPRLKR